MHMNKEKGSTFEFRDGLFPQAIASESGLKVAAGRSHYERPISVVKQIN